MWSQDRELNPDLILTMDVLYQLSYLGALFASHAHFLHDTHSVPIRFCQDSYLGVFNYSTSSRLASQGGPKQLSWRYVFSVTSQILPKQLFWQTDTKE